MSDIAEGVDVPRHRSPPFPFIALKKALERAREFYEKQRNHPAPAVVAVTLWNYAVKSSGGLQTIAALKHFGLMEDEGSGADRKVKLTEPALRIIRDSRDVSPDRDALIKEAALAPRMFRAMYDHFGPKLPSEGTVIYWLVQERGGYTENSARELLATYVDTIAYAGLDQHFDASDTTFHESNVPALRIVEAVGTAVGTGRAIGIGTAVEHDTAGTIAPIGGSRPALAPGERIVFAEEVTPEQSYKIVVKGEFDEELIEALEFYIERQKRRIEAKKKKQSIAKSE